MSRQGRLMEMLVGYAASHRHPFNVMVHMVGIPTILFGVLVPCSWFGVPILGVDITLAHAVVLGLFLFYLALDRVFAIAFLAGALLIAALAGAVAELPLRQSAVIAAVAFFGGYTLQFVGHAVERSMPVLVKHPVQANLAAPLFTVVELFKLAGFRQELFDDVQSQVVARRAVESGLPKA